jgi:sporulation protein YlmC with PRC-barrel domain
MNKLKTVSAAVVLAMSFAPNIMHPVLAESLAVSAIVAQDHSMRSSKLIGMDIYNDKGEKIGKIEDILVRGTASEPLAVLSVGGYVGIGTKMVAVPLSHITLKADKASMPASKTELASMAGWQFTGLSGGGG